MPAGRPPKRPRDRRTDKIQLPLTEREKRLLKRAARLTGTKHVTWCRETLLKVANRMVERSKKNSN